MSTWYVMIAPGWGGSIKACSEGLFRSLTAMHKQYIFAEISQCRLKVNINPAGRIRYGLQ